MTTNFFHMLQYNIAAPAAWAAFLGGAGAFGEAWPAVLRDAELPLVDADAAYCVHGIAAQNAADYARASSLILAEIARSSCNPRVVDAGEDASFGVCVYPSYTRVRFEDGRGAVVELMLTSGGKCEVYFGINEESMDSPTLESLGCRYKAAERAGHECSSNR